MSDHRNSNPTLLLVQSILDRLTNATSSATQSMQGLTPILLSIFGTSAAAIAAYHCYLLAQFSGEAKMEWAFVPILGHALAFGQDPIGTVQRLSRQRILKKQGKEQEQGGCPLRGQATTQEESLKEIVGVLLAGQRIFLVNDPASFKVIFKPRPELSFEHFANDVLVKVFGATPEVVNGPHAELAPLVQQSYQSHLLSDKGCEEMTDRMQVKLAALISATQQSGGKAAKVVDLLDFVNRLVYRASAAALFNEELADCEELYQQFLAFDGMFALALAGVPLRFLPEGLQGREAILSKLTKFQDDISTFMEHRHEMFVAKGHPERDTAASQLGLLWASVGNTMPATFWVLFYLLSDQEALQAVKAEVQAVLGEKTKSPDDLFLSFSELSRLDVLDSVISEALRLSSGSLIMRRVTEACSLTLSSGNTYKFRKGDSVGIFPPVVHRDESLHADPDTFVYDRFLVGKCPAMKSLDNGQRVPASSCMIPFGGGSSYCPGRKFARAEIKALVAQILVRFDVQFASSSSSAAPAPPAPKVDLSRAGLGVFQPKDCSVKVLLTPK